ncbi:MULTISPECIES: hypothetical protein [unclassified Lentimonas]|uniref:hypothetical protein n=1 Tax=unclassified Lentimonas TaxID=2630993 RepID=UPI0013219935|nr:MULTISPECIES: hypothetical protein [unclassified Lentimonas]CAA6676457.1 Unannotated [Lentimonas sp. CC4]CAA6685297.1 Unannotated [Lentimonas sp. CC6]CAA7074979.1 Unannotated [Lentimonas sp. CC4]CAA7171025.1 Unannotated [Lentimonas sp. CC21]CAA7180621.1 Unannotated [Lentimonas sp. CC8]
MSALQKITVRILSFLLIHACLFGERIEIDQSTYSLTNDLNSGGVSGQTFITASDAKIVGIRLFVKAKKWSGSYPYGSEMVVSLYRASDGIITGSPIAQGSIDRDGLILDTVTEADIYFDLPYDQAAGECLAFTILETSGGGSNGYNEYGMSNQDPYSYGTQFYSYSNLSAIPLGVNDMAFQTLVSEGSDTLSSPGSIQYTSPSDGTSFNESEVSASIEWTSELSGVYEVYLSRDVTDPTDIVATQLNNQWTIPSDLDHGTWYWKVSLKNPGGVTTGSVRSFTVIESLSEPESFNLWNPVNETELFIWEAPDSLSWYASANAEEYDIYLEKENSTPSQLITTTSKTWAYIDELVSLDAGVWYWRVVARNSSGVANSTTARFIILPARQAMLGYTCWNSNFYSFEVNTGVATKMDSPPGYWDLDFAPDGTLYGASRDSDQLVRFAHPITGETELLADLPVQEGQIGGISVSPDGKSIYLGLGTSGNDLWRYDLEANEFTNLGSITSSLFIGNASGIEVDDKGDLYVVTNSSSYRGFSLYRVDWGTLIASKLGPSYLGLRGVNHGSGLCYADGAFYTSASPSYGGDRLVLIEPETGIGTFVSPEITYNGDDIIPGSIAIRQSFQRNHHVALSKSTNELDIRLDSSVKGNIYRLQESDELANWHDMEETDQTADGAPMSWFINYMPSSSSSFYRIRALHDVEAD